MWNETETGSFSKMHSGKNIKNAKLLIIDDEKDIISLLKTILERGGFTQIVTTMDPRRTIEICAQFEPDIVLLDLHMPFLDGFEVMCQLRALDSEDDYLPVIVLTADITTGARNKALAMGAKDFLLKPIEPIETLLRVRNLLETRFLNRDLERRVRERTREVEAAQLEVLHRLSQAMEFHDDETGLHTHRVGELSARVARQMGLTESQIDVLRCAAPLHDVGKIGIPDSILLKRGLLTAEEFSFMKTHALIGAHLLREGHSELVRVAEVIARTHHERWDGTGYPNGLKGEEIPIEGRILAVCDVFDALTHTRPYKAAWPLDKAIQEIESSSGTQFDPAVVDAFLELPHEELLSLDKAPNSSALSPC